MQLRDYQTEAVDAIYQKFKRGCSSQLLIAATGAGKTVIMGHVAKQWGERERVMVLAHRDELLTQAREKVQQIIGDRVGIEGGGRKATPMEHVFVASVQSLMRGTLPAGKLPSLLMIDEAHHASANSYANVIDAIKPKLLLGVTATPWRADKRGLSDTFEDVAYEINLLDLIRRGYLTDVLVKKLAIDVDLDEVRVRAGDYSDSQLGKAIDPYIQAIADTLARNHRDRKALIFLPLVENSRTMCAALKRAGLPAEHVDGKTSNRAAILERFSRGEIRWLCNAQLLTEGYDEPSIDTIVNLRATKSLTSFAQILGRGTRLHGGKDNLLYLDPTFRSRHMVVGPQHIVSDDEREAHLIAKYLGQGYTLRDAAEHAEQEYKDWLARQAEKAAKESLEVIAFYTDDAGLATWEPSMRWHNLPATPAQLRTIEQFGAPTSQVKGRGLASAIIDRLISRRRAGLATYRQVLLMHNKGIRDAAKVQFQQAKELIDEIKTRAL